MKTSNDPRHNRRIAIVQDLFADAFLHQKHQDDTTDLILKNLTDIDDRIAKAAPQWPLDKIARVDLAILRLAVYELCIEGQKPPKVIIDEAVEIAKEMGGQQSGSFVNGVMGTLLKEVNPKS